MTERRTRYAIVGTGGRAGMYVEAIMGPYSRWCELVGLCDLSQVRMDYYNSQIALYGNGAPVPTFLAADFDKMVREKSPDIVIVTSMDCTHHQYIIRAMELGCDAISEKPMTIDGPKARAIFDAIERTGKSLRSSANCT